MLRSQCMHVNALLTVLIALIPSVASAQIPQRGLGALDAEFKSPVTAISGLRELPDGRLIVADGLERTLQVIDLGRQTSLAVGREGAGPGEWQSPSRLFAHVGDSTVMDDLANARFLVIDPSGLPSRSFRLPSVHISARASLVGMDRRGRMVLSIGRIDRDAPRGTSGIVDIVRFDPASQRVDTITTISISKARSGARTPPGGSVELYTDRPFAPQDVVALASDGRLAVVHPSPFRVEWFAANGERTVGPVVTIDLVRITRAEKDAFIRSRIRPGRIVVSGAGGSGAGAIARSPGSRATSDDMTWPTHKPPFLTGAAMVAPDGRVWVERARAHDDSTPSFDVFDARGEVAERIVLPRGRRLVAFGATSVYLERLDEDGLHWIERYRHP